MRYAYPAILEPGPEGGFTVTFAGVSGVTWGETREEALEMAVDALVTILSGFVDDEEPLPRPAPARGRPLVSVPTLEAAKLALHEAMMSRGMTNMDLAREMGLDEKAIRRLRDPLHRSHIGQVEAALRRLGRRVIVDVVEAA